MAEPLTLRLHGVPALIVGTAPAGRAGRAGRTPAPQERALEGLSAVLVARLAVDGPQPRADLAALLWPQADAPRARANLRQRLLRLKALAGQEWIVGDATLALAPQVSVAAWDDASAASAAEWLQGVQLDAGEAARWVDDVRARLRTQHLQALSAQLTQAEAERRWPDALALAERMVALDPHSEDARRQVVRLHYLGDDLPRAQAGYARLCDWLRDEVGAPPSASTRELGALLERARVPSVASGAWPVSAPSASVARMPAALMRPPQCVGRDAELQRAARGLAVRIPVVLVGEAGLGKSRLLAELAQAMPGRCLKVGARPGDASVPFALAGRWLQALLQATGVPVDAAARATLAALNAEWREGQSASGQVPVLIDALRALLAQAAEAGWPTMIVDDLHFADGASAELLAGLALAPESPVAWLLAHRPGEGDLPVREALALLDRDERVCHIELRPLDVESIQSLLKSLELPGVVVGEPLAGALLQRTGGNPLFVLETLKQALLDGSLSRGELPHPAGLGALIERRLRRLSEPALALARIAAIAGLDFSVELAEEATGLRALQMASAWQELQEAQVLRDEAFAHDLVADAVLRGIPQVVARRVHGQCAQWLADRDGEPARVAWHWLKGGRAALAAEAFCAAAQRASQVGRLVEEAGLFREAAAAFDDAGLPERAFDARLADLTARVGADFGDETLADAQALVGLARGDAQRLQALRVQADLLSERSQADEAIVVGEQALALARRLGDADELIRVACFAANALCRVGRAEEAQSLLLSVRTALEGQPDLLVMLWHGDWAAALGHLGRLREAQVAYELAMQAARREGRPDPLGRLMVNCAVTLRQAGRLDQALALSREGSALVEAEGGGGSNAWTAALVVSRNASEAGDFAAALPVLEDLLPRFEASGATFWAQACRLVLVQAWLHLGQPGRALPLLRDEPAGLPTWLQCDRRLLQLEVAQALRQPSNTGLLSQALELAATDAQRGTGLVIRALRHRGAHEVLQQVDGLAHAIGAHERLGALAALCLHRARAASELGRHAEAVAAARQLLELLDDGVAPESTYRAEAWWVAGQALKAAGQADAAASAMGRGAQWVQQHALPRVPAPFVDSFLYRNPVNRALLAAVGSVAGG